MSVIVRRSMNEDHFKQLIRGKVVRLEQDGKVVEIALADIGSDRIIVLAHKAYEDSL